jgi:hypothetical protein
MMKGMPFTSKSQLRTCYGLKAKAEASGKKASWDCDEWLKETPNAKCLPNRKNDPITRACRSLRKDERVTGPIQMGPRGGKYFIAEGVKIYLPRTSKTSNKRSPRG